MELFILDGSDQESGIRNLKFFFGMLEFRIYLFPFQGAAPMELDFLMGCLFYQDFAPTELQDCVESRELKVQKKLIVEAQKRENDLLRSYGASKIEFIVAYPP